MIIYDNYFQTLWQKTHYYSTDHKLTKLTLCNYWISWKKVCFSSRPSTTWLLWAVDNWKRSSYSRQRLTEWWCLTEMTFIVTSDQWAWGLTHGFTVTNVREDWPMGVTSGVDSGRAIGSCPSPLVWPKTHKSTGLVHNFTKVSI